MVMIKRLKHLKQHNSPDSTSHRDRLPLVERTRQTEEQNRVVTRRSCIGLSALLYGMGFIFIPQVETYSPLWTRLKFS